MSAPGGGAPGGGIVMPPPPGGLIPGAQPYNPQRGNQPEQSTERQQSLYQTKGPTIPGVAGQPSSLGIPGGASPAIGPGSPQTRRTFVEESGKLIEKLPRTKTSMNIQQVREEEEIEE